MQIKNMRIIAEYVGKVKYQDKNHNSFYYHQFVPENKTNELKWIKITENNPILSNLTLKEGEKYELNWIEKDKKRKRVFRKNDNIVIVSQKNEPTPQPENKIEGNECSSCKQSICKKGSSAYQYFISLDEKEIYENNHWCANCLPVIRSLCETKMWGTNKDDVFGSNLERLHKSKVFIKTVSVNGKEALVTDATHQSPWTCPWCEEKWSDSESKDTVLNHYSQLHGIGKTEQKDQSNEEEEPIDENEDNEPIPDNNNNQDGKVPKIDDFRSYCKTNDIKKFEYDEDTGKLLIYYKTNKPNREISKFDEELEKIREYVKQKGKGKSRKKYLESNDWEEDKQERREQWQNQNKTNRTPWIIAGGIGLFIIVLIAVIGLVRKSD